MANHPRVALLTREFPPEVYGGAGVHVEYLARELAGRIDVRVHCFGEKRSSELVARTYQPWAELDGSAPHLAALRTMSVDLTMVAHIADAAVVHRHTWYANFAGHLAKLTYGIPHVVTSHSLEPLRPWKAEQLGGGYALSSFCERTAIEAADAVIAVSQGMRADILAAYPAVAAERVHVIYNGIDPDEYRPTRRPELLARHGIAADRPYAMFVGRITRQKGVVHLLEAAEHIDPGAVLGLCAGAPDTPEIAGEFRQQVDRVRQSGRTVVWIESMLPREEVIALLSMARVFVCPSVYEPFGIVNLEAMACQLPVVATRVGGIPEIVVEGDTGFLIDPGQVDATGTPLDREAFARALAEPINQLLSDADRAATMGERGRQRVCSEFSWSAIAERTAQLYRDLAAAGS